jgi:hypothetical protein
MALTGQGRPAAVAGASDPLGRLPRYLCAQMLGHRKVSVQIARVAIETPGVGDRKQMRPVLYFEGRERGLVLSRRNTRRLASRYGYDS